MYFVRGQLFKIMIRYVISAALMLAGLALPLWGASPSAAHPAASRSSKAGSKTTPAPVSASVKTAKNDKSVKNAPPALTSDLTRATKAALLASAPVTKPRPGSQPAVTTHTSPAPAPSRKSPASVALAAAMPVQPLPTFDEDAAASGERLARVTAYWRDEGDYYTGRCLSATGVRLHDGHCAVDPNIIPYGSVVDIKGVGTFLAVDTGSAVISRTAAREGGQTSAQRHAIVVDLFFRQPPRG